MNINEQLIEVCKKYKLLFTQIYSKRLFENGPIIIKTRSTCDCRFFKELEESELDILFSLILEEEDQYNLDRIRWPDWLTQKYEKKIQIGVE